MREAAQVGAEVRACVPSGAYIHGRRCGFFYQTAYHTDLPSLEKGFAHVLQAHVQLMVMCSVLAGGDFEVLET